MIIWQSGNALYWWTVLKSSLHSMQILVYLGFSIGKKSKRTWLIWLHLRLATGCCDQQCYHGRKHERKDLLGLVVPCRCENPKCMAK